MKQSYFASAFLAVLLLGCDGSGGQGNTDTWTQLPDNTTVPDVRDNGGQPGTDTAQGIDNQSGTDEGGTDTGSEKDIPGVIQSTLYESGTRIKAKVAQTADGAKAFQTWYDTQLDADCHFVRAPDGKERCMPNMATGSESAYFSDEGCTQLFVIVYINTECFWGVPRWAQISPDNPQCPSGEEIYEIDQRIELTRYYYKDTDGKCIGADATSLARSFHSYSIGSKVNPSIFAEVTVSLQD